MLPDRVSNLTYESGALPIALRGPAETGAMNIKHKSSPYWDRGLSTRYSQPMLWSILFVLENSNAR